MRTESEIRREIEDHEDYLRDHCGRPKDQKEAAEIAAHQLAVRTLKWVLG